MMACLSHNADVQARIAKNAVFQSFIGETAPHGIIHITDPEATVRFFDRPRLKEVRLMDGGVTINRPPHDRHRAFLPSPDAISVKILQDGALEPAKPRTSIPNNGE